MKKNYRIYNSEGNYVADVIETSKSKAIDFARNNKSSNPFAAPATGKLTAVIDGVIEKVETTGKW